MYKTDDVLVVEAINSSLLIVAVIQAIIYKQDRVYFLVYRYEAIENEYGFFETTGDIPQELSFQVCFQN